MTEREDVRAQQQHRPRLRAGQRPSDGRRVGPYDAVLELGGSGRIDPGVGERPETGRHAVDGLTGRHRALDHPARGHHTRASRCRELHSRAPGHGHDVLEREELSE